MKKRQEELAQVITWLTKCANSFFYYKSFVLCGLYFLQMYIINEKNIVYMCTQR